MMRIQEMVDYLQNKGFIAYKTWNAMNSSYKFTIQRGDRVLTRYYRFTPNANPSSIEIYQKEFLDNIIKEFEEIERKTDMFSTDRAKMHEYEYALRRSDDGRATLEISGVRMPIKLTDMRVKSNSEERIIELAAVVMLPDKEFEAEEYIKHDTELQNQMAKAYLNSLYGVPRFRIEKVIFNAPATIVIWADGTKTVVKTQNGEAYDPEKGLAMAISKKALGNKGNYFDTFKKWTKVYDDSVNDIVTAYLKELWKDILGGKTIDADSDKEKGND